MRNIRAACPMGDAMEPRIVIEGWQVFWEVTCPECGARVTASVRCDAADCETCGARVEVEFPGLGEAER